MLGKPLKRFREGRGGHRDHFLGAPRPTRPSRQAGIRMIAIPKRRSAAQIGSRLGPALQASIRFANGSTELTRGAIYCRRFAPDLSGNFGIQDNGLSQMRFSWNFNRPARNYLKGLATLIPSRCAASGASRARWFLPPRHGSGTARQRRRLPPRAPGGQRFVSGRRKTPRGATG